MKRFPYKSILTLVCLNAVLYVFIVVFDVMKAVNSVTPEQGLLCDSFKYAAIISCLIMCVISYKRTGERTPLIQSIVFSFTLGADLFLLFTPFFAVGVFIFIGAHICALIRYRPRWALPAGICAAAVFVLAALFASKTLRADAELTIIISVCAAYAVLIISVTISTFHSPQARINTLFSRFGMCLFLACDVNVAFFNALPADAPAYTASIVLMWLFYLPAQTLLALSACKWPEAEKKPEAANST